MTTSSSSWSLKYWPDSVLHTICTEGKVPKGLVELMTKVMMEKDGLGLACSQVGETNCRVFIMRKGADSEEVNVFANPIITERSADTYTDIEGCLSFPGQRIRIRRSVDIFVDFDVPPMYEFQAGEDRLTWKFSGLQARCIQHEIDHLNGVMIFDQIQSAIMKKLALEKYFKKRR